MPFYIHVDFPSQWTQDDYQNQDDTKPHIRDMYTLGYRFHEKIYEGDERYQPLLDHIQRSYPQFKPSYEEDKQYVQGYQELMMTRLKEKEGK